TWNVYVRAYQGTLRRGVGQPRASGEMLGLGPASEVHFFYWGLGGGQGKGGEPGIFGADVGAAGSHLDGVYAGLSGRLDALQAAQFALGIVTGKSRGAWEVTVRKVPRLRLPVVITEDEMPRPKPDPTGLRLALDALGLRPTEAIYIGDSLVDTQADLAI